MVENFPLLIFGSCLKMVEEKSVVKSLCLRHRLKEKDEFGLYLTILLNTAT